MTYPREVRDRGFTLYVDLGTLRKAHAALSTELRQKGATAPSWRLFGSWSKQEDWRGRRQSVDRQVQAATEETIAQWRARRAKKVDAILDELLADPKKYEPKHLAQLLEVADRLRGGSPGGDEHEAVGQLASAIEAMAKSRRGESSRQA